MAEVGVEVAPQHHARLLRRLVKRAGNVGNQCAALFKVLHPANQYDEHIGSRSENNGRVMVDFWQFAGFVGDLRFRGHSGWNAFVEFLAFQDGDHLFGSVCVDGLASGDGFHQHQQPARGRGVVKSRS